MSIFMLALLALVGVLSLGVLAHWVLRNPDQAKREAERLGVQAEDAYAKITKKNEGP